MGNMIKNIQFDTESTKGYAYKLGLFNSLANPLPLTTGVNVFFGPNGCGKSTLLKMIGKYTTCVHRDFGYEAVTDPDNLNEVGREQGWYSPPVNFRRYIGEIEKEDMTLVNGKRVMPVYRQGIFGKLDLAWDGCPTYYQDCTIYMKRNMGDFVRTIYVGEGRRKQSTPDFSPVFRNQPLGALQEARSKGESTLALLSQLEEALQEVPTAASFDDSSTDPYVSRWEEYILSRGPAEGYTFLLDEPETHLSISAQRDIWNMLIEFSQQHNAQIIAASHSPLVLFLPNVNIIEFKPGYAEESRKTLREIVLE